MKNIKKVIAALSAVTMTASCVGMMASAAEKANVINVSYSTVDQAFTTEDGTEVPVGATAVTLSIENNTGFKASDITLNTSADLLKNTDGMLTTSNAAYAMVSAAQNGEKVAITGISSDTIKNDGALVTFYTVGDAEVSVTNFDFSNESEAKENSISPCTVQNYYTFGDLNRDGQVNSADASEMLVIYDTGRELGDLKFDTLYGCNYLPLLLVSRNCIRYNLACRVEAMDGNYDRKLVTEDSEISDLKQLMEYLAKTGAGLEYNASCWHWGERVELQG